jgi:amino acid transporter
VTVALVVLVVLLMAKTMGWEFFNAANSLYFNSGVKGAPQPVLPIWPYPVMMAGWLVNNAVFQVLLIVVMGAWFFGWAGTLFLSSTRVIFAAAFDRVLPAWAANISAGRRVPYGALILMIVPSLVISAIYAYNKSGFYPLTLDATLVIAVTYLGTIVAASIMPWRRRDIYQNSPIARYKVGGVPLLTVAGIVTAAFLIFNLYKWATDSTYGVNNTESAVYLGILYVVAVVIYVVARIVRGRQGIDLRAIHREIPVE